MVINLSSKIQKPFQRHLYKVAGPIIERGLAIRDFNEFCGRCSTSYREHPDYPSAKAWFGATLSELQGRYEADLPPNFNIPAEGPLIIVANHPFGILDPIVLCHFISRYRPFMRCMTNFLLNSIEGMEPWMIPVDPFNSASSAQNNFGPMKEALRFLRKGGALAIFPSGEVAHYKMGRGIEESPWSSHVGALVRRTQAMVLPVYFPGQNSVLFHTAGLVHPMLRTGLLFREFFQRSREVVEFRVGQVIPYSRLRKFDDDASLTRYLRLHTFVLSQRSKASAAVPEIPAPSAQEEPSLATTPAAPPEIPASRPEDFVKEIEQLRAAKSCLTKQGNLSVFVAGAAEIPHLLREIGRLREISFREVGEGTGEEIDLDRFDDYYMQIFMWDEQAGQIVGAYRMGRADSILKQYGPKGLYTNTLFRYQKPFLAHLDDALELGRSFIAPQYQRNLGALPLLWRGVLHWVCRHPRYTKLYGPVSISKDYHGISRQLIVDFLRDNRLHPDLATLVKPRRPFRYMRNKRILREFISAELSNIDDFSALISSIEEDGKGIPILLKHYLRLKGTLLSFNVDKAFSSCVDGLIMIDLTDTDTKLIAKYMGEAEAKTYLAHHGIPFP